MGLSTLRRKIHQASLISATAARDGVRPLRLARRAIQEFGAVQRTWELQSLLGLVLRRTPLTVVEIGTYLGGTLACWPAVSDPGARLVSIDMIQEPENLERRSSNVERIRRQLTPRQRLIEIEGDSHSAQTLTRLKAVLDDDPVDLLWIDGDHSYEGITADMEMYAPLVRRGGLIALHDIHGSAAFPTSQCHTYWREAKRRYRTAEFIADRSAGAGMGIGVIFP